MQNEYLGINLDFPFTPLAQEDLFKTDLWVPVSEVASAFRYENGALLIWIMQPVRVEDKGKCGATCLLVNKDASKGGMLLYGCIEDNVEDVSEVCLKFSSLMVQYHFPEMTEVTWVKLKTLKMPWSEMAEAYTGSKPVPPATPPQPVFDLSKGTKETMVKTVNDLGILLTQDKDKIARVSKLFEGRIPQAAAALIMERIGNLFVRKKIRAFFWTHDMATIAKSEQKLVEKTVIKKEMLPTEPQFWYWEYDQTLKVMEAKTVPDWAVTGYRINSALLVPTRYISPEVNDGALHIFLFCHKMYGEITAPDDDILHVLFGGVLYPGQVCGEFSASYLATLLWQKLNGEPQQHVFLKSARAQEAGQARPHRN